MTMAICMKCGGRKVGALSQCGHCGFEPEQPQDRAKSLLLSDHNLSPTELQDASGRIERGERISFDDAALRKLATGLVFVQPKCILGVRKTSWIALGIAIAIGVLVGTCFTTLFRLLGL